MVLLNYWAVLVAGVVGLAIGFLWHGPLFGKTWMRLMGMNPEDCNKPQPGMWKSLLLAFISTLVMAFALAHALIFAQTYLKVSDANTFLQGGFWNWLGFIAPVTLSAVLWEKRSWKLWCFENAYWLVELLAMGAILVSWK